jgi:hypothetical protein
MLSESSAFLSLFGVVDRLDFSLLIISKSGRVKSLLYPDPEILNFGLLPNPLELVRSLSFSVPRDHELGLERAEEGRRRLGGVGG